VGCEIYEQLKDVQSVVVPVGGGGLISGVAAALKALKPSVQIIGVQAKGAASFGPSLKEGRPIALEKMSTIADGIAANSPGELTLAHVARYVDEVVEVSDESIARSLVFVAERMKLVLEPSGAAGVASVLEDSVKFTPPVVVLLSGGNVDPLLLLRVIRFGLSASGRYFAFQTHIDDRPGELHRLLGLIADSGANLVGVEHRREGVVLDLGQVEVSLQVETRGPEHIEHLTEQLSSAGYPLRPV
jgi:threonine dehydratase